jgi:raffinose/stachyose/melibiose transport system substrate-binding protein
MIMKMRSWYRGVVAACAAAGLLLSAAACGSDDDGGGGGDAEWWHIQTGDGALVPVFSAILEDFLAENEVNLSEEPIANDDFKPALTTAMQAGNPPDMFHSWGGGVLAQYVAAGLVRDLTDDLADVIATIEPSALEPYTINDRVYGLPFDTGMIGVWYNKELFADAGLDPDSPPATWDELLDAVDALEAADITPIAQAGQAPWTLHYWFSYLAVRIMGVDGYADARSRKSFDEPGFYEAAELFRELVDKEPFQDGFLQQGYGGEDSGPAVMGAGGAAMELMGQWGQSVQEDSSGETLGDEVIGWFPFPEVAGGAGSVTDAYGGGNGHALGINAPDYMIDFLRYFSTVGYQQILDADPGIIPITADAEIPAEQVNRTAIANTLFNATAVQLYFDQDLPPAVGNQVNASSAAIVDGSMTPEEAVLQMHQTFQSEPDFEVGD